MSKPFSKKAIVLLGMMEALETDGWIRGNNHGPEGHCLQGAYLTAIQRSRTYVADVDWNDITRLMGFPEGYQAINWNDRVAKNADEVLQRVRSALTLEMEIA